MLGIKDEPDCMTLKEYFKEVGKEDRAQVTGTLKQWDHASGKMKLPKAQGREFMDI